LFSAMRP